LLSGEKGTKIAEFDLLSDKLDEVRNDLFRKDNSPDLQKEFMAFYFEERLMLRPEDIAKKLKQGDVVVTSPLKKKSRTQAAKYSQAIKKKMSIA
jgi:Zn-dependent M28 family amino/carboxypeptidase